MLTQEEMCCLIQTGTRPDLIPALWESVRNLYTLKALRYYNSHRERCERCGAAPEDLQQQAFFGFLKSIDEYKPGAELPFTAYINLPFLKAMQELLMYRTARGRNDAMTGASSLDEETDDDGGTLHDIVPDAHSLDFIEALDAQSVSEMVRAEVRALPDRMRFVIERYFFDGETLDHIAAALGVSGARAGELKRDALRKLSHSRNLAELQSAFSRNAKLRQLEAEARSNAELEKIYLDTVRNMRSSSRTALDDLSEEQQALLLWTAGADIPQAETTAERNL